MKTRVAFAGRIRSGKDTAADYVAEQYKEEGYHAMKLGFADGIADVIRAYFPGAFDDGKPREHFQVIGQTFRLLDADVWVRVLMERLRLLEGLFDKHSETEAAVIVKDLRQQNELERLHAEGFVTIKVVASEETRLARMDEKGDVYTMEAVNHPTEVSVDGLHTTYTVTNDGTLDELYEKLDLIFEELLT